MKLKFKRYLSIILSAMMLFTLCFTANAAVNNEERKIYSNSDFIYELMPDNTITIHFYIGTSKNLTIPAKIDNYPVTTIEKWAFYESSVQNIVISEGITTLCDEAFFYASDLISVSLPSTLQNTGTGVFRACTRLKQVSFEDGAYLGKYMFYGCTSLEDVTLPNNLSYIPTGAFGYCESLEEITLPNNLSQIYDYAFYAGGLWEIILPESIRYIGTQAFAFSTNLQTPDLDDYYNLSIDDDAFWGCIPIPDAPESTPPAEPMEPPEDMPPSTDATDPPEYETTVDEAPPEDEATVDEAPSEDEATPDEALPDGNPPTESTEPDYPDDFTSAEGFYFGSSDTFQELQGDVISSAKNPVSDNRKELLELAWNVRSIGDANGDNMVNIRDATIIQKYVASLIPAESPDFIYKNSDVDTDGKITVKDATKIQKFIAGNIKSLY